uniref:Uncharacterized protein n=1 Tax=Romanomermis culicivorax TaxID=13658 RepID=A0A915K0H7_ROMCU
MNYFVDKRLVAGLRKLMKNYATSEIGNLDTMYCIFCSQHSKTRIENLDSKISKSKPEEPQKD